MGTSVQLDDSILESFTNRVRGPVIQSGDEGYDEARSVWNGLFDKEPALIVRCTGVSDVMEAVNFGRECELPLAVKGGGHGMTGHAVCDDGIVIDLSPMDSVRVDPNEETVRVRGGATWEAVNHEALHHELLPPGIPMSVGVAGFTLGGGMSPLSRTRGLAIDNLRSVDIVTADGELVHASEEDHPDLFWALRGGGGNFGIATSFEFECFDMNTEFKTADLLFPVDAASDVLRFTSEAKSEAPDELSFGPHFYSVPEDHDFPQHLHGETVVSLSLTYIGEPDEAAGPFEPFLEFGDPIVRTTEITPYTELYSYFPGEAGERNYWKSLYLDDLSDDLIETLVDEALPVPTSETIVSIYGLGGAVNRYEPEATAYPHRDASHLVHITTRWSDSAKDEAYVDWTRELHKSLRPYGTGGEYVNNQTDDACERVRAAYGDNYDRLVDVKNEWDPDNLFRMNKNIEPTI